MTSETWDRALGELDPDVIERYFMMKQKYAEEKVAPQASPAKGRGWLKWAALAAGCFLLVVALLPLVSRLFGGTHGNAPVPVSYDSLAQAHAALGRDTLCAKLDLSDANVRSLAISYRQKDGAPDPAHPLQLLLRADFPNSDHENAAVFFYVIFGKNSVDDSYIGGYEEQGLTKELGGVTVHYSIINDGAVHGQAKFLYGGDLYVVDINAAGDVGESSSLDRYLAMLLG